MKALSWACVHRNSGVAKWCKDCSQLFSARCKLVGEADEGPKVSAAAVSWDSNGINGVITDTVTVGSPAN
jgi:hypothetical protein